MSPVLKRSPRVNSAGMGCSCTGARATSDEQVFGISCSGVARWEISKRRRASERARLLGRTSADRAPPSLHTLLVAAQVASTERKPRHAPPDASYGRKTAAPQSRRLCAELLNPLDRWPPSRPLGRLHFVYGMVNCIVRNRAGRYPAPSRACFSHFFRHLAQKLRHRRESKSNCARAGRFIAFHPRARLKVPDVRQLMHATRLQSVVPFSCERRAHDRARFDYAARSNVQPLRPK